MEQLGAWSGAERVQAFPQVALQFIRTHGPETSRSLTVGGRPFRERLGPRAGAAMLREFREFVTRGNIVELAVAFVMGVAFAAVVTAFTDVLLGTLSYVAGGDVSFDQLGVRRDGEIVIPYGAFLTGLLNFLLVAIAMYFVIKAYNAFQRTHQETPTMRPCPYCRVDIARDATRCPNCTSDLEGARPPAVR